MFSWSGLIFQHYVPSLLFTSNEKYCLLWLEWVPVQDFVNNSKDLPNRKDSSFAWVVTPSTASFTVLPLLSPFPLLQAGTLGLFYCLLWLYCLGEWSCFQLSQLPTDSNPKTPIALEEENQSLPFCFVDECGRGETSQTTWPVIWSWIISGLWSGVDAHINSIISAHTHHMKQLHKLQWTDRDKTTVVCRCFFKVLL